MGSFACNTQKYTQHRIISKWIELTANLLQNNGLPLNHIKYWTIICMHSIRLDLFMHVIKSIANSICKQIFDNGHCLTNLIVAEETIELRGFLSGDLFFYYRCWNCIKHWNASASRSNYSKYVWLKNVIYRTKWWF